MRSIRRYRVWGFGWGSSGRVGRLHQRGRLLVFGRDNHRRGCTPIQFFGDGHRRTMRRRSVRDLHCRSQQELQGPGFVGSVFPSAHGTQKKPAASGSGKTLLADVAEHSWARDLERLRPGEGTLEADVHGRTAINRKYSAHSLLAKTNSFGNASSLPQGVRDKIEEGRIRLSRACFKAGGSQ